MGSTNNENDDSVWNYGEPGVVNRIDAYFFHSSNQNNYFLDIAVLIIGGLEYNDDPGGCQEDPGELNGVV